MAVSLLPLVGLVFNADTNAAADRPGNMTSRPSKDNVEGRKEYVLLVGVWYTVDPAVPCNAPPGVLVVSYDDGVPCMVEDSVPVVVGTSLFLCNN